MMSEKDLEPRKAQVTINVENDEESTNLKSVEDILNSFTENLFGVDFYFKKFEGIATGEDLTIIGESEKFDEQIYQEILEEMERLNGGKVTPEQVDDFIDSSDSDSFFEKIGRKLSKRPKMSSKNFEMLSRGSFLMLNNYFEYLLTDLLTYHYTKFQNSLNNKEFKVSLQELNEFESIDELTRNLILKEVENIILEKSFESLLDHFEENLKISRESEIINWDQIIEIRERRHLIVHNSSIVNKKYLSRSKNPFKLNLGDTVQIDKDYFHSSYKYLLIAGQILSFNCWGQWDKDKINDAISDMLDVSFEKLSLKDFELTLKMCKYCDQITPRNEIQEDYLLRIKINKGIAYKKMNNKSELSKLLATFKIGTASPIFKIAYQILNDDNSELVENCIKAIVLEELTIDNYMEWPLFDSIRDSEFHNEIIDLFKQ